MPPSCKDGTRKESVPDNHLTSLKPGHKFPLYRSGSAAVQANKAFTVRSSGAMFGQTAPPGFHLFPALYAGARAAYSFRRRSYGSIPVFVMVSPI